LGISYRDFTEYRGNNQVFSEMAGNTFHNLTLTGAGEPSIVNAADVTPEIFSVLRAGPLAGRALLPEDGKPGAADVAAVSEDLWRSRFGSNPTPLSESFQQTFAIRMALPVTTCGFL
jgi:putative ABC transport system permease protein